MAIASSVRMLVVRNRIELVANVVDHVHGDAVLTLELSVTDAWLRIAVADGSSVLPVVQELSHDRPRGRGLRLVEAIADRWAARSTTAASGSGSSCGRRRSDRPAGLAPPVIGDGLEGDRRRQRGRPR
jgi:hypothetical protein